MLLLGAQSCPRQTAVHSVLSIPVTSNFGAFTQFNLLLVIVIYYTPYFQVLDTLEEIQERHDAAKEIEKKLLDLHQVCDEYFVTFFKYESINLVASLISLLNFSTMFSIFTFFTQNIGHRFTIFGAKTDLKSNAVVVLI